LKAGADFADIEYENFCRPGVKEKIGGAVSESGGRLILSAHNFEGKLEDMGVLYRHIEKAWAGCVPKLVYKAGHINDCFEAFDLLHETSGDRIVLCMGEAGVVSRILAKKFGGLVTFASVGEGKGTAPGQLTAEELRGVYRYGGIDEETELFGVIGAPVGHSVSPAAHNACFGAAGMNRLYLPLLVEGGRAEFGEFMDNVIARPWLGFKGFSVTIPHKGHAMDYVTRGGGFVEALAAKIGAVNTVTIGANGRVSGFNTDYAGARNALCAALGVKEHGLHEMKVAVLGAGGVARAVVAGLADAAAKVTIYNRTVAKAAALAEEFGCGYAGLEEAGGMEAEVVINCTSIGMYPDVEVTPLAKEYIKAGMAVFDTVYNPVETRLLREAKEAGARTIDGVEMFVRQAAAQFELFTGAEADAEVMREAIRERLGKS